ncbi:MAG: HD domain-containing protein [Phycisphaerales bacterium]|nr:HD domain-containing protein [Phycisphaerales bacterium]
MKERRTIREFGPSERIEGVFAIANAQLGKTRNDKPYLRCLLRDKSGEVSGRMWSIDEAFFRRLPTDGFVYIEGETQKFQGDLQLIIHTIQPYDPAPEEMRDLLPTTRHNVDEMFAETAAILGSLEHPAIKALAEAYLGDEMLMAAFRQAPAAKSMHHAYLGGLLEHTLNLLRLADRVCPLYPGVNRDIVVMGLFLHDLGKTRELAYDGPFTYTDRGELVGHIVEGAIMLHDKVQHLIREKGVRLPPGTFTVLQHIILSHHGVPEYGAAKVPMTPEALIVSMLDNLDAKVAVALAAARPEQPRAFDLGGNFTDNLWALGTKLFRPDPLAPATPEG